MEWGMRRPRRAGIDIRRPPDISSIGVELSNRRNDSTCLKTENRKYASYKH